MVIAGKENRYLINRYTSARPIGKQQGLDGRGYRCPIIRPIRIVGDVT